MISNRMILNRDFKSSVWFFYFDFKSFCAWFMILNHQNLPANHEILPEMRFLLQSLTQHISWNGCRPITAVKCHKHLLKLSPWGIQPVPLLRKVYKQSADSWPGRWWWLWLWTEQLQFIGSRVVYKPSKGRSYELPVRGWQVTVQAALLSSSSASVSEV